VLVFKFKKKGIARLKPVPEAYFASNTFCLSVFFEFSFPEFPEDIEISLQLNASFSISKIRGKKSTATNNFYFNVNYFWKMAIFLYKTSQFL